MSPQPPWHPHAFIFGAVPCSKPAGAFATLGIGCLGAMRGRAKLPSKTHSCSELEEGNRRLLAVKQEAEKEDELQRQIKDWVLIWGAYPIVMLLLIGKQWCLVHPHRMGYDWQPVGL